MVEKKRTGRNPKASREERQLVEEALNRAADKEKRLANWVPKTETGRLVRNQEITSLDMVLDRGLAIMEPEIVDTLVPELEVKMVDFKKTARVRMAGRQFAFRVAMLIGDKTSFVGLGVSKDRERWPAVRKATRDAKLNLFRVRKGCGSWECMCGTNHSVPVKITGKSGSVRVTLIPAPKGTGLVAGENIKDVLRFAGVKDTWCKTRGSTGTKLNFVLATIDALNRVTRMRISEDLRSKGEK
ncbi:MAG TPA: 30S ribosomal protein S5 [Candidatus Diapherotrites archaeon]|uniref:Small ribosomal subunit protein uS5 n=1 Tax=Candidatus Iainarchaeum sp. TaxID=3101447 RepID=A0A7J4JFM6_9ARCH|nr:30S ribosomal protein S5 [Candidatus Diapherotrites archaeon]HIH16518.1 30S ribosomal protein S5 [Candidatus Diapherotrites archaeon]